MYDDPTASSLGWWTDNGAYYHYDAADDARAGSYERSMADVKRAHDKAGLPFKHWQLDSWW